MSKYLLFLITLVLISRNSFAIVADENAKWGVTVTDPSSPYQMKLGIRVQAMAKSQGDKQYAFLRRTRLNVAATFLDNTSFYMDVRDDNVDNIGTTDHKFQVGDFNFTFKFKDSNNFLKILRTKVDVSRSQTAGSAQLIFLDRAMIADYAANYINDGRRSSNFQLNGHYKFLKYHIVAGDGVNAKNFKDVAGNKADSIDSQNFMYGAKIKFTPEGEWNEGKVRETYYGEGKHITLGAGFFNTSSIKFTDGSNSHDIDRTLQNYEFSFHYYGLNFISEYFIFGNQIKDLSLASIELGKSKGGYALLEYTIPGQKRLAPFVRYETWDLFESATGYEKKSTVFGLNYYYKKEKARVGIAYTKSDFEQNITDNDESKIATYLMMNL